MAGLKSKALDRVRDDVPVNLIKPETQPTEKEGRGWVRVNFEVPPETRTEWRAEALRRNRPLSELIREAMSYYLSK